MQVTVHGDDLFDISDKEVQTYVDQAVARYGDSLLGIDILLESEDEATITYKVEREPFERIRRITGYLVGTMDKWNDAKRAEEHARVKHNV